MQETVTIQSFEITFFDIETQERAVDSIGRITEKGGQTADIFGEVPFSYGDTEAIDTETGEVATVGKDLIEEGWDKVVSEWEAEGTRMGRFF